MLNTVLRTKERWSRISLLLSAIVAVKYMRKKQGGKVRIARGARLVILPRAMITDKKGMVISASAVKRDNYVCLDLRPDGASFDKTKPAELRVTWEMLNRHDIDELTLYSSNGEEIKPETKAWGVVWRIPHFSLYYFRRR
jgi:hypothetical protein